MQQYSFVKLFLSELFLYEVILTRVIFVLPSYFGQSCIDESYSKSTDPTHKISVAR